MGGRSSETRFRLSDGCTCRVRLTKMTFAHITHSLYIAGCAWNFVTLACLGLALLTSGRGRAAGFSRPRTLFICFLALPTLRLLVFLTLLLFFILLTAFAALCRLG